MADLPAYPGTPRWVNVFGIIAIILVLIVLGVILTGIGGPHGPGRHLLTVLATVVLLLQTQPIGTLGRTAAETPLTGADLRGLRISLVTHAAGGLLVLLVATTLAVYKPRGLTRYGWSKQHS